MTIHLYIQMAAVAALMELASASQAQHKPASVSVNSVDPFGFRAYGVFRLMITERNYRPVIALKDAVDAKTTDAVGALSGLRGEISMINGKLIVSYGADCAGVCAQPESESATLLATASVQHWRSIEIEHDLDAKAVRDFIRAQAETNGVDDKPFPFRIEGTITNLVMHINAAPNPRFKGHCSFDEMAITGLAKGPRLVGSVVGFHAPPPLQGVITHMGDYFHMHYVDEQRTTTAHLDSFGVAAGARLLLPARP
jgi:acetolactate decarboxylase